MDYSTTEIFNLYLSCRKGQYKNITRFFFGRPHIPQEMERTLLLKKFKQRLYDKTITGTMGPRTRKFYRKAYYILYRAKIEELPIRINETNAIHRHFVKWRLSIGK